MDSTFFAIVYAEGQMSKSEIVSECSENQFSPVLIYTRDGIRWLPIMREMSMASDFAKRNIPRNQIWGVLALRHEELELAEQQGLQPELLDWPKKLIGRKDLEVSAFPLSLPVTPHIETI